MSNERLALLKAYCKLDDLDETGEKLLKRFYSEAVGYMAGAGVSEPSPRETPDIGHTDRRADTGQNKSPTALKSVAEMMIVCHKFFLRLHTVYALSAADAAAILPTAQLIC